MNNKFNDKQREIFEEFWQKRANIREEMIWIGCNPSDPVLFKQQSEDGFKLLRKMRELAKEYLQKIEEAE